VISFGRKCEARGSDAAHERILRGKLTAANNAKRECMRLTERGLKAESET